LNYLTFEECFGGIFSASRHAKTHFTSIDVVVDHSVINDRSPEVDIAYKLND
jgi:hypothetical protein